MNGWIELHLGVGVLHLGVGVLHLRRTVYHGGDGGSDHRGEPEHILLVLPVSAVTHHGGDEIGAERAGGVDGAAVDGDQVQVGHQHGHGDRKDAQCTAALQRNIQ